ncbi:hypothetical protein OG552_34850 [Streptomyces sp. NBC_01476]|uniref:hypothetical protein n=1 Tax=Streptomyces sp. NBC_01476 TaxID=2903881 RepID=UPI002E36AC9A|nr:hypothetical protein [Streptomyces sp. NBC_01476]
MSEQRETHPAAPRRRVLVTALGTAAAATVLSAGPAAARDAGGGLPGSAVILDHDVDVARATPRVVRLLAGYFRDKTARDADATMAHFARRTAYVDATLGWPFYTWQDLSDLFHQLMPTWPATARSYPTKILGDADSALVFFTDTPELFGHEIRPMGLVNFKDGRIARWVDYWDGREFTLAGIEAERTPADQFPADFKEGTVGETAAPAIKRVAASVSAAFARGDVAAVARLFTADGVLEDLTTHTKVTGHLALGSYLGRAITRLPYGPGANVRHVVGSSAGGGYEWTNPTGPVPRGAAALELDRAGLITHLTAVWDGSLLPHTALAELQSLTIES